MAGYNFKSEEEVKEFLKNLHTEYSFGCYSEKNPEACHLMGDYLEAIKSDYKKAGQMYKNNCDSFNYSRSCSKYGGYLFKGKGCDKNETTGYAYMKKACDLGDIVGCTNGGVLALNMLAPAAEDKATYLKDGVSMLKKACEDKDGEKACFFLSGMYIKGVEGLFEPNLGEAYACSLRACELGNPYACANVSQMYARGEGAKKDMTLAESFKKKALELHKDLTEARRGIEFAEGIKI